MTIDLSDFGQVKERAEVFYANLSEIHCPYFKGKVSFNASGLEHLKFKRHGSARAHKDQYMRLKLLHLAPEILKTSSTLQGFKETKEFVRVRVHSRTDTLMKDIAYYEFDAVVKKIRVKVIVKRIADGQPFFWSIIPFWGMNNDTNTRKIHSGDPESD